MGKDLILKEIEENKEEYIEFLKELVQSVSYNPPGDEMNIAVVIKKYLTNSNIECEIFPFEENRANLIVELNNNKEGVLLFNAHMDVVPPGIEDDWKYPPLSGYIKRNKYMFGRGTTDMKSALASMIISLKILKKLNIKTSKNLIVNAVADEETGGKFGTGWCLENVLIPRSIKCDFTVVGEPSGLNPLPKAIIIGEKGHLIIRVVTNGISAHSMAPSMGKNAIYMMSHIIENLYKLSEFIPQIKPPFDLEELKQMISSAFQSRERFEQIFSDQPLLQSIMNTLTGFTHSLNVIKGGIKVNVIPDKCEALIDFRLLPDQTSEMIMKGLEQFIQSIGYEVSNDNTKNGIDVYLEIQNEGAASIWKDFSESIKVIEFKKIVEEIYSKKSFYFLAPGSTDAHYYRNNGYCKQTIHFGPGSAGSMHALNENIEIQDFLNSIKVYALFAYKYLTETL